MWENYEKVRKKRENKRWGRGKKEIDHNGKEKEKEEREIMVKK